MSSKLKSIQKELELYKHYAHGYGQANGECEYGYPQHPGYICGLCGYDRSDGNGCGKMTTRDSTSAQWNARAGGAE